MAVQPKDVKNMALMGEFDSFKNPAIQIYLDLAIKCTPESIWGGCTEEAVKLLTAHYLTLASRGGKGGSITAEKVGNLAQSFSAGSTTDDMASTSYGMMYSKLRKTLVITPMVVGCPE